MNGNQQSEPLLEVTGLSKYFILQNHIFAPKKIIKAVDDVSFTLYRGETLGLIGESGSGKTTLSHLLLGLSRPDRGKIIFKGQEIDQLEGLGIKKMRKEMQMVFQSSFGSLDPLKSVYDLVTEGVFLHGMTFEKGVDVEVENLLERVGLGRSVLDKKPGQLSGGQKQRVGIARALAIEPSLLILDEPVSALDVSVQGQIANLLMDLKKEMGLTYLFITHDLDIACHLSDRLAVMYQGKLVEIGSTTEVVERPCSEYARQLVASLKGGTTWF